MNQAFYRGFLKRAEDAISQALTGLSQQPPQHQGHVLRLLSKIQHPFKVPDTKSVLSPFNSQRSILANAPNWSKDALPQYIARINQMTNNPAAGIKEMLAGWQKPPDVDAKWGRLALEQPVNAGFSNAVVNTLRLPVSAPSITQR